MPSNSVHFHFTVFDQEEPVSVESRSLLYACPEVEGWNTRGAQAASNAKQPDARAISNLALVHESGKWGRHCDDGLALRLYR
jgi:hypothetical protein